MATKDTGGQKQTRRRTEEVEETEAHDGTRTCRSARRSSPTTWTQFWTKSTKYLEENAEDFVPVICPKRR